MATALHEHEHQHGHTHEHSSTHEHGHEHDTDEAGHDHRHDDAVGSPGAVVVETGQHHGPSHDGSVVLDIGGSIGAVALHVPEALAGLEIDIIGISPGTTSTHSLVRPRMMPDGTRYAAVYPGLPEGSYQIVATAGHPAAEVEVRGGTVSEVDWRS